MTQLPTQSPVIQVKAQPNVYTVMLIVAILALGMAVGFVMYSLMAPLPKGYGMEFDELFKPLKELIPGL